MDTSFKYKWSFYVLKKNKLGYKNIFKIIKEANGVESLFSSPTVFTFSIRKQFDTIKSGDI